MKKLLAFLILSSVLLLAGCGTFNQKEAELGFFDEGLLAEVKLTDMPVPDDDDIRHDEDTVYCNMTEEKRIEFANKLASYLIAKDDIYYKGYHYETGCVGGIFFLPEYRFAPLTADADYGGLFAFSLTESLNNGDEYNYSYWNGVTVSVSMKEGKIGSYSYNTVIKINKDPNRIAFYPTEHEHTITYVSAGVSGHFANYECGCPYDHGAVPHYDEDIDLICDACGYVMPEHEHTGEWHTSESTHYYQYTCGCPSPDIAEFHSDYDENFICDICEYVMNGHEHTYEYNHDDIGHGWSYTCGCMTPPNFAQHFDGDGDGKCDEDSCGYDMSD